MSPNKSVFGTEEPGLNRCPCHRHTHCYCYCCTQCAPPAAPVSHSFYSQCYSFPTMLLLILWTVQATFPAPLLLVFGKNCPRRDGLGLQPLPGAVADEGLRSRGNPLDTLGSLVQAFRSRGAVEDNRFCQMFGRLVERLTTDRG